GSHNAGVTEQKRLRTFWSTVANAPGVKNADNIMFELMNEPVDIESSPGNGDWGHGQAKYFLAFRNWIQPVINDIRSTGANNIVWVPTLEWEGSPQQHVQYPFTGTNCGVAVHYYPTYGGCYDNVSCHNNLWNKVYKPAADIWPMIITENFWFPEDTGLDAGSTANYGNTLRANMTKEGNVSYMVGFLSDLLDDLTKASPANCNLSSKQGAQAAFEWFYQDNSSSCTPTAITPYVKINSGAWSSSSTITVNAGDTLTIGPQPLNGGSWNWTGPNSFSSSTREILLTNIQSNRAGVYTATYTNTGGCKSTATFNVTVNMPCTPTAIISYVNVNNGTWINATSATVAAGGSVTFGPQPLTGGSWSWSGPDAFTASTREILFSNAQPNQSGGYVATYTNAGGCKSTLLVTLTVNAPCSPTPIVSYVKVNKGTWALSSSATVNAGDTLTFGPQPLTGGTWNWTGPNAYTASTREISFNNIQANQSGNYVATYTNAGGCKSSNTVSITVVTAPPVASDFTGPDCGTPNSTIAFELNADQRASATSYSWWFQGYNQSMTPAAGAPYKINIATGPYFTGGQMCVGVNYSIAPYYASYCKTISLCAPSLTAAAVVEPASIAPNPSTGAITVTVSEDAASYKLVNDQGLISYSGGHLSAGESATFGDQLRGGQYILVIQYASGRIETLKVMKL
ncbi:MAG: immunoglobulin domain-containing protein, partial [Cytophaga sp.]|uniref:immunoglobulin domain-containing protein n=1 Tax=Cytophaga sp. TaxID=29535 RepID=UPI003F7EAD76